MKKLIVLLFLLIPVLLFSQNESVLLDISRTAYIEPVYANGIYYAFDVYDEYGVSEEYMRLRSIEEHDSLKAKVYFTFNNTGTAKMELLISNNIPNKILKVSFNSIEKHVTIPITKGYEWISIIDESIEGKSSYSCMILQNVTGGDVYIKQLRISGSYTVINGIRFNKNFSRGAYGYSLWYDTKDDKGIEYFYNEVTIPEGCDPYWIYFMVIGWHGLGAGYSGIQNRDPKITRILLYSVWNTDGHPNTDTEYNVTPFAVAENVNYSQFDGEGDGISSNLWLNWETSKTYCFLANAHVRTKIKGSTGTATDTTFYSLYWKEKSENQWHLQAIFISPYNGDYLKGLHSFHEDYVTDNSHKINKARFSNQWIKTIDGEWKESLWANAATIQTEREDKGAYADGNGYVLWSGGFISSQNYTLGTRLYREPSNTPCPITKDDENFFNRYFNSVVNSITLNKKELVFNLKNTNNTEQLEYTVLPISDSNKDVYWESSNPEVATVSSTGLVTAKTIGNAIISVTTIIGRKTATCTVNVDHSDFKIVNNVLEAYYGSGGDVVIPNGVIHIKERVFYERRDITSITLPNSVISIGLDAFYNCSSLTSIILPNSLKIIGQGAFWGCSSLVSIAIPVSVTDIGPYLFWGGCTQLKNVEVRWQIPLNVPDEIFNSVDLKNAVLTVPKGTKTLYQVANVWKDFGSIVEKDFTSIQLPVQKDRESIEYFDLLGRKVLNPQKGQIYITNNRTKIIYKTNL